MIKYYDGSDRLEMILRALRLQNMVEGLIRHLCESDDPYWIGAQINDLKEEIDRFDKENDKFLNYGEPEPTTTTTEPETTTDDRDDGKETTAPTTAPTSPRQKVLNNDDEDIPF